MLHLFLTGDEALEERLRGQVGVVLLEVLGGGSDELDGHKLETGGPSAIGYLEQPLLQDLPSLLEAGDDLTDESTL